VTAGAAVSIYAPNGKRITSMTGEGSTFHVTPWSAPRSALPVGPAMRAKCATGKPHPQLDRVLEHVVGWSGMEFYGRPIRCTQNAARALLTAWPHVVAQLVLAIDSLSRSNN
jgi:hypothetical protein